MLFGEFSTNVNNEIPNHNKMKNTETKEKILKALGDKKEYNVSFGDIIVEARDEAEVEELIGEMLANGHFPEINLIEEN